MRPDRPTMHLLGQTSRPQKVAAILVLVAILCSCMHIPVFSQPANSLPEKVIPEELWRAGLYFGMNRNLHRADHISGLPGVPSCCPDYTSGNGGGIAINALAELPFNDSWRLGWRLSYESLGGTLRTLEYEEVNADRDLVLATFEHTIESSITALGLESSVGFGVWDNFQLFAGLRADFLTGQEFRQQERLAEPEGVTYENGQRVRMEYEGEIQDAASFNLGIIGMLRYDFYINDDHTWVLAPEIGGWYGMTDVVADLPWRIHGGRVGLSVQYIARRIPSLVVEPVDLIVPIESEPGESSGTERDE